MKRAASRRTTLTLPARSLEMAERIAKERHQNLSSVVGEALERGLSVEERLRRSDQILRAYQTAFSGFSGAELLMLDGVIPEKRKR